MRHNLKGDYKTKIVLLDKKRLYIKPSFKFKEYARFFDWGSENKKKQMLQLALSVMVNLTGSYEGYHKFKHEVIDRIPEGDFEIEFEIPWKDEEMKARNEAIIVIHAYHKNIPSAYFRSMCNEHLINWVNSFWRDNLAKRLNV